MDDYFAREAKIIDIVYSVYDLNKDQLRIFIFDRNIYYLSYLLFNCEIIILYVPLGSIYILALYILGNIEKQNVYKICNKGTWV